MFAQVVAGLNQHAARPHGGVVHAHAFLGVANFNADAHHLGGGVELTGFFAGRVGKIFDEPFVGGTQQIGEFKVAVFERDLVEVLNEIDQGVVVQRGLANFAVEVDGAFQHVLQGVGVVVFQGFQGFVERGAYVFFDVLQCGVLGDHQLAVFVWCGFGPGGVPAGAFGDEEVGA